MGFLWDNVDFLVLAFITVGLAKVAPSSYLLAGLYEYRVGKREPGGPANGPAGAKSSKASKKLAKERSKQDVLLGGAETVTKICIPAVLAQASDFFDNLDFLFLCLFAAVMAFGLEEVRVSFFGRPSGFFAFGAAVLALTTSMLGLAQVQFWTPVAAKGDKQMSLTAGVVAAAAATALLMFVPPGIFAFPVEPAAAELDSGIGALLHYFLGSAVEVNEDAKISRVVFSMVLGHAAGLTTSLLLTPAVRYARSFWVLQNPPDFATAHIAAPLLSRLLLIQTFVAPAPAILAWVEPLTKDWPLDSTQLMWFRFIAPLGTAVLLLLSLRTLVQGYLNTGLLLWWTRKHGIMSSDKLSNADRNQIGDVVRKSVDFVHALMCKVAVQMLGPPTLLLGLLGIWYTGGQLAGKGVAVPPGAAFWSCTGAFLTWWACITWLLTSFMTLCLFRFGVIIDVPR